MPISVLQYRTQILAFVGAKPGIRDTELILDVMRILGPGRFEKSDYQYELQRMIHEGRIKEIIHQTLHKSTQINSIYFPSGTTILNLERS